MPLTTAGKNVALDGLKAAAGWEGLFTKGADITSVTSTGSPDTFAKTAHGLSSGDTITFASITGGTGATPLVAGDPYYVATTGLTANAFQVARTSGGPAVDFSSDVTAATVNKWTELSGGSPAYARKAIAWGTTTDAIMDDSTNGNAFDVPSGANVDAQSLHSASGAGTLYALMPVTREAFGAQGVYTSTDVKVLGSS
jgi:hypothetical protein